MTIQGNKSSKEILELKYASILKRFFAFLIDVLLLYLNIFLILKFGLNFKIRGNIITFDVIALILFFIFLAYLIFFNIILKGQTLGQKCLNIKVVSIDGSKPKIWQIVIRSIGIAVIAVPFLNQLVLFLGITWLIFSFLLLLIQPTRQRRQVFWDVGTKTCVIENSTRT